MERAVDDCKCRFVRTDVTLLGMNPVALIAKKRDGFAHSTEEIEFLVQSLLDGSLADYQMSAWLMAAWLRGLDAEETLALTRSMLHSGSVLTLPSVTAPKVDKHSTGGVGDKISICLAPLVAACGVAVPMISGRGLGHTGGTLDKLEAIDGYQTRLDAKKFERIVKRIGTSMIGQTDALAPADRRIYALRDVTATVESVPLITASILSKKLAEGIDALVLDVKVGEGAFMRDLESARVLARSLVDVGTAAGKRVSALLTDMNVPIGRSIGNALETREAIDVLRNAGPADTRELTLMLGAEMLCVAGTVKTETEARAQLERALADGSAFERFVKMVVSHGGSARQVQDPSTLPCTKQRVAVPALASGWVTACNPRSLAWVAVEMGAGRTRAEDRIDPAVGIELAVTAGERVQRGEPLAYLHVHKQADARPFMQRVTQAFSVKSKRPPARPLLLERVSALHQPTKTKRNTRG
jgi:pyrimidine-nucleoside phosphorylase